MTAIDNNLWPAGAFTWEPTNDKWWWSPELYGIYGLNAKSAEPSTDLLLAHQHSGDRARFSEILASARRSEQPSACVHRITTGHGYERVLITVVAAECDHLAQAVRLSGYAIDVTDALIPLVETIEAAETQRLRQEVTDAWTAMESRASIDQARGVLMAIGQCGPQAAWEALARISNHSNTKVREVAQAIAKACDPTEKTEVSAHLQRIIAEEISRLRENAAGGSADRRQAPI